MTFLICVNMPGCLPDSDPYEVATEEAAIEALDTEIDRTLGGWSMPVGLREELAQELAEHGRTLYFGGEYFHTAELSDGRY